MIEFHYETEFELHGEDRYRAWILSVIESESKTPGEINYIFCDDNYLLEVNRKYLNHDTFTDIISFDYSEGDELHGDIFLSVDRIRENALIFNVGFEDEMRRVMVHGILHYAGYDDKTNDGKSEMRSVEEMKMNLFHVKP